MDPYDDTNPIPPLSPARLEPVSLPPLAMSPVALPPPTLRRSPSMWQLASPISDAATEPVSPYEWETEGQIVAALPFPPSHAPRVFQRLPPRSATVPFPGSEATGGMREGRTVGEHLRTVTNERDTAQHISRELDAQLKDVQAELAHVKKALTHERDSVAVGQAMIASQEEELRAKEHECAEKLAAKDCAYSGMVEENSRILIRAVAEKDRLLADEARKFRLMQDNLRAQGKMAHLRGQMEATTTSFVRMQGQLAAREGEVTRLRAQNEQLSLAFSGREREFLDLGAELKRANEVIAAQYSALSPRAILLSPDASTCGCTARRVLDEKEATLADTTGVLRQTQVALERRNEQLEETAATLAEKEETLELRDEVLAGTAGTLDNAWATLEDVQAGWAATEAELEAAQHLLSLARMEAENLRNQVTVLTEEREELAEKLREMEQERHDLQQMVFETDITGLWSSRSTQDTGNVAEGYGADDHLPGANAGEEGYDVCDHRAAANAAEEECDAGGYDANGYDADDESLPGHTAEGHDVGDDSPAGTESHKSELYEEPESDADVPAAVHAQTAICDEPSSYDPARPRPASYFPESYERGTTSTGPSATSSTIVTPGLAGVFPDIQEAPEPGMDIPGDSCSNSLGLVLEGGSLVSKEA